ncbi:MAG: ubiquinone/menaquinone biosynthesis methyltransferase [Chloroflexi bacterium]|nr:ubiquinone/menaquinone biosynthesis methyltransferase [Chloroflexota bacterium]
MPVPVGDARRGYVNAMFGRIARRYDLMNSLMTFGLDRGWRAAAVRVAAPPVSGLALDVGTGTGKLALRLAEEMPAGRVLAADFTVPMLRAGQPALRREGRGRVAFVAADALELPFPPDMFDCVVSAFAVRNLADVERGFREQARVAKPGGRVVCLELTTPPNPLFAGLFRVYFRGLVPRLGGLIAGDSEAYTYLPESVAQFLRPRALAAAMRAAGLERVRYRRLGFGAVALHIGAKPSPSEARLRQPSPRGRGSGSHRRQAVLEDR